jgi:hypothetical protein
MSYEKLTPIQNKVLREQTIDAVKEGTALPVYEGMQDQEIIAAFRERLENMSKAEFDELGEELMSNSDELVKQIAEGDGSLSDWLHSVKGNGFQIKIGMPGTILATIMTGLALNTGSTALSTLTAFNTLLIAWLTKAALKEGQHGVDKIKQIRKNTEALVETMMQIQIKKYQA